MFAALFKKLVLCLVVLSLSLGQGAMAPAMAAPHAPIMSTTMANHGCCPQKEQSPAKSMGISCLDACLATAQATLPAIDLPKVSYVAFIYPAYRAIPTDGCSLLPDYPPPKA